MARKTVKWLLPSCIECQPMQPISRSFVDPEMAALLCLLRSDSTQDLANDPLLATWEWERVSEMAITLGVAGKAYAQTQCVTQHDRIPQDAITRLRQSYQQIAVRNLHVCHALYKVLGTFRVQQIDVLVLKGFYLAHLVYDDIAQRTMADVDLLVQQEDAPKADKLLRQLGYQRQAKSDETLTRGEPYHETYRLDDQEIEIEIHWHLSAPDLGFNIDTEGLWQRSVSDTIAGIPVKLLSPEDNLLHLCFHTAFHHGFNRYSLRGLIDIQQIIRHYDRMQWPIVCRQAEEWGCRNSIYISLLLARDLLHATVPNWVLEKLQPPRFDSMLTRWAVHRVSGRVDDDVGPWSDNIGTWHASSTLSDKLGALWQMLFPPRQALLQRYQFSPHTGRSLLYYRVLRYKELALRGWRSLWGSPLGPSRSRSGCEAPSSTRDVAWTEREAGRIALSRFLSDTDS